MPITGCGVQSKVDPDFPVLDTTLTSGKTKNQKPLQRRGVGEVQKHVSTEGLLDHPPTLLDRGPGKGSQWALFQPLDLIILAWTKFGAKDFSNAKTEIPGKLRAKSVHQAATQKPEVATIPL